ncbi:uncharacterized protein LOC119084911 [Bradysia coprophila]|uniref:uncharacterized protein LOC119084911 n=1 Tax=Bradysia coprophila TaxID=38358 RepID=UPI00187DCB9C|nr:uncharacterized protein LOC119084911 [Bradysia coprophila]
MKGFLKVLKKYSVVVIFPTFTASTIYADWSHTKQWKASKIQQHTNVELVQ